MLLYLKYGMLAQGGFHLRPKSKLLKCVTVVTRWVGLSTTAELINGPQGVLKGSLAIASSHLDYSQIQGAFLKTLTVSIMEPIR